MHLKCFYLQSLTVLVHFLTFLLFEQPVEKLVFRKGTLYIFNVIFCKIYNNLYKISLESFINLQAYAYI